MDQRVVNDLFVTMTVTNRSVTTDLRHVSLLPVADLF